jgi:4-hydroxybenzoate polyprenyltransferase
VEFDKKHPRKRFRPIASGRISVGSAHALAAALLFFSLALSFFLNRDFFFILAIYAVIEVLYSVYLKDVVILDVFCIASGFLLRVLAGAVVLDVPVSDWLLICTIFLSLFLALSKRRSEMVLLKDAACEHRRVLSEYSIGFIDQMVTIVTASTIFSYVLYAFSPETLEKFHTKNLCYTIIFVVYGIFRYLYLVYQKQEGHTPENVFFTDKPFLLNILLYAASVVAIIYVR